MTRRLGQLPIPESTGERARLLARIGASLLGDTCVVALVDGTTIVPVAVNDRDASAIERAAPLFEPVPLDRYAIVHAVLATGEPSSGSIEIEELRASATRGELAFLEATGVHSYLVVPLRPSIGVVVFLRYRVDRSRFYREHVALAIELADTIAPQLDTSDGGTSAALRS